MHTGEGEGGHKNKNAIKQEKGGPQVPPWKNSANIPKEPPYITVGIINWNLTNLKKILDSSLDSKEVGNGKTILFKEKLGKGWWPKIDENDLVLSFV